MKVDHKHPILPVRENQPRPEVVKLTYDEGAAKLPAVTPEPDTAQVAEAVEKLNKTMAIWNHSLRFELRKDNRIVIHVIDSNTGEVVRQIPPDELVNAAQKMESALGLLIDRRV